MRRTRPIMLAAVTAPLLATCLVFPAPAAAGASAAAVPDCVITLHDDEGSVDTLVVTNGCRRTVRVQVQLDNYPDPDCTTIPDTESRGYSWYYPGRYAGLRGC